MLNFNVKPYWDDFDETKNYHRVLFKPGFAVQARELTQSQTILQNQITKFADHIFVQNSPVSGGKLTVNQKCYYLKLQDTYNDVNIDVNEFDGLLVKDTSGTVLARVIAVVDATGGDPPTLILSYLSGPKFGDGDTVYDTVSNLAADAITTDATGESSVVSIADGVFYVLGNHESYGFSYEETIQYIRKVFNTTTPNCTLLENGIITQLEDYTVIGCTLWTDIDFSTAILMNDCKHILKPYVSNLSPHINKVHIDIQILREWYKRDKEWQKLLSIPCKPTHGVIRK